MKFKPLGWLFSPPTQVDFLGVCESWSLGIITHADGIRCLWSISTEIFHWISLYSVGSPSEAKVGQALSFGNIFTFLNCIFVAGARSKSQLYSKAGKVCIWRWISSLIYAWFFPSSSVSSSVPLCSCSDKQDRDFVIRSLPSHGVPAVFCLQLSSQGWGSFAFTMLHTALNCVGKAKYCRPDAAFPLLFISLENNLTPGMELCCC